MGVLWRACQFRVAVEHLGVVTENLSGPSKITSAAAAARQLLWGESEVASATGDSLLKVVIELERRNLTRVFSDVDDKDEDDDE